MSEIRKVAVIGAGVMGAGIAAHIANAGAEALLLDIVPEGERATAATIAKGAIQKLLKAEPAAFMSKAAARLVTPGNIEDDIAQLATCDWIIEAVVERLDVKQALYGKIEAARRPGTPVSSNTSTIPLTDLTAGLPESFRRDFLITHFFNPPRYMRLLEIVTGPETDAVTADRVAAFADVRLGKTVVRCKDTPGFIANRLGTYWLQAAVVRALDLGLTVEEADVVMGRPFGFPKTGVFGLIDLVGLDLMPHVVGSLQRTLPASDPFHGLIREVPVIDTMLKTGMTGRKGKGRLLSPEPRRAAARRRRPSTSPPAPIARRTRRRCRKAPRRTSAPSWAATRPWAIMRGRSWAARSPMRRASCPRRRTTSWPSMKPCALATTGNGGRSS